MLLNRPPIRRPAALLAILAGVALAVTGCGRLTASANRGGEFSVGLPAFPAAPPAHLVDLPTGTRAPVVKRIPTSSKVAFITIDDGWVRPPDAVTLMRAAKVPFTIFPVAEVAKAGGDYFRQLVDAGAVIGDHSVTHPHLIGTSYAVQHRELCDSATTIAGIDGTRPSLVRPPFGEYDDTTLRVAHDCGYAAVVNWSETVEQGVVRYQTQEQQLKPGDIILLHFTPTFVDDMLAALRTISAAGLTPAVLSDYLVA